MFAPQLFILLMSVFTTFSEPINFTDTSLYEGSECFNESKKGICKLIPDCPEVHLLITRNEHPQHCGFVGQTPVVCCFDTPKEVPPSFVVGPTIPTGSGEKFNENRQEVTIPPVVNEIDNTVVAEIFIPEKDIRIKSNDSLVPEKDIRINDSVEDVTQKVKEEDIVKDL